MTTPSDPAAPPAEPALSQPVDLDALNDLFTRSYYSAAGYVFESQPYALPADADVLDVLSAIRREDRRHAQLLAGVLDDLEAVPLAGAFPYWYRDVNYLSVPCLAGFVVEALRADLARYAAAIERLPASAPGAQATLVAIRREKEAQLARLLPMAAAARAREAADNQAKIDARKAARAARLAKEKAAKESAKKAAAKPAAAKSAVPAAAVPSLDPNEPGIAPKERARRQMLAKRGGGAAGAPAAAAAAPAPVAAGLDPNEPGITPKEKARRQMLAKRGGGAAAGAPASAAPAAVAAPAPAPAPAAPAAAVEEDLDPDEDGLAPKEKARRTMLRKRRAAGR